jgi:histidyl-tRNA synthetase
MESVGGRSVPGIGFAIGDLPLIECLEAIDKLPELSPQPVAALILVNRPEAVASAHRLAHGLREAGVRLEIRALTDSAPAGSPDSSQDEARWVVFPVYQGQGAGHFAMRNTHTGGHFLCGLDEAIELVTSGLPGHPAARQCNGSTVPQWLKGGECIERTRAVANRSSIQR